MVSLWRALEGNPLFGFAALQSQQAERESARAREREREGYALAASARAAKLLGLHTARVCHQQSSIVGQQNVLQLILLGLVDVCKEEWGKEGGWGQAEREERGREREREREREERQEVSYG